MSDLLDVAFVELVLMTNVPHDRHRTERDSEGRVVTVTTPGESLSDTANRIEDIISQPPKPVPVVPYELRDPDAPTGWYDEPDTSAQWAAFAERQGLGADAP